MGEIDLIKTAYGFVDKLTMEYNGNQLITVSDSISESTNRGVDSFFIDGVDDTEEYTYDANGNTTSDKNKGISEIIYNELNMPQSIYFNDGHITEYLYDASGQKLRVIYKIDNRTLYAPEEIGDLPEDESAIETVMTRDYIGNHVYEDGILERTFIANGYITGTDTYNFYINDYQGNNVLTVEEQAAGVEGNHRDYNLYYPYGSPTRRNYDDRYMYSGKELDDMNGLRLYDFSARSYDAIITRFLSPDPMRSKYPHISPYAYCAGNPIMFIDPTGMAFTETAKQYANDLSAAALQKIIEAVNASEINWDVITEAANTITEIIELDQSSQLYDVEVGSNKVPAGVGVTRFDMMSGVVIMSFGSNNPGIDIISHEFKHSSQFERGEYGFNFSSEVNNFENSLLYDEYDEIAAYRRSNVFGGITYNTAKRVNTHYENLPLEYNSIYTRAETSVIINGTNIDNTEKSKRLQKAANRTKNIFRYNSKTYIPQI